MTVKQEDEVVIRDGRGRFLPGNTAAVGRGNPMAARVYELRKAMWEIIEKKNPETMLTAFQEVVQALVHEAKAGNVPAARLVMEYCLGKPVQTVAVAAWSPGRVSVVDDIALPHLDEPDGERLVKELRPTTRTAEEES